MTPAEASVSKTELYCGRCVRMTLHEQIEIPPFKDSRGGTDPGRLDWHCSECGDMYEPPSET